MPNQIMGGGERQRLPAAPDREAVSRQLHKILTSPEFVHAERLSRFLRYVVEHSLSRPSNSPKEHEIALEVFDRGDGFDSRLDSIVRVQANRLRSRLNEFYRNGGSQDDVIIEIPSGSYAATIRKRSAEAERDVPVGVPQKPADGARKRWLIALQVAVFALAAVWLWRSREPSTVAEPPLEPIPFTTYAGWESDPSFSPDGTHIAFAWKGAKQENHDIYVQRIGSSIPTPLTDDSAHEFGPAWSPDGKWIAFLRGVNPTFEVRLVTPLGDRGPVLATVHGPSDVAWTPDSRWLVVSDRISPNDPSALFLVSLETREKRRLTTPTGNISGDFHPAISPDGRNLAFVRGNTVMTAPLTEAFVPAGEPRRVFTGDPVEVAGIAWTPDGREIILCGKTRSFDYRLWRVAIEGSTPPRRISDAGGAGLSVAISRADGLGQARLAYAREVLNSDIWRLELGGSGKGVTASVITSTRNDTGPQYSPDGKRIAFASDRSGAFEIWVCNADGTSPAQLTTIGDYSATPRWSPDGKRIAFDSTVKDQWEIYAIDADNRATRRLTNHPALDAIPSWSRDGKWVYFASDRTGESQVWKAPAAGEAEARQVTTGGGHVAFESFDGKLVYYTKAPKVDTSLWSVPVEGGTEREVLKLVSFRGFAPARDGIWFLKRAGGKTHIQFHTFADGRVKTVASVAAAGNGLAVSPDGASLLYTKRELTTGDLMLIERFR